MSEDIDVGQISEALNDKADRDLNNTDPVIYDYVIEYQAPTSENNYTWYRLYKSGWIEQGGVSVHTTDEFYTINLPKEMQDENYTINVTLALTGSAYTSTLAAYRYSAFNITSSSFQLTGDSNSATNRHCWRVEGIVSQES